MTDDSTDISRLIAGSGTGRRPWVRIAVAAFILLAGAAWWIGRQDAGPTVTYDSQPVIRGALTVTVTATGTVQPTTKVDLSSELSGTLVAVDADFNDRVTTGQTLARLDDTKTRAQVANATASVTAARARLRQAEATATETAETYKLQQQLEKRGITARRDFISTDAEFQRSQAAVEIARADLTVAEANLELAKADLENSVIRAPIDGIVLSRTAEVGQIVASSLNAPVLFTLAGDLSKMDLQVDIDEADIGRIAPGNEATFTVDAFPGRSFPARIAQVRYAPETTDNVVTYKAVLTVENPDGALRPGMTATATITVAKVADSLIVPNAALRYAPPQAARESRGGSGLLGLIMPRRGPSGPSVTADGKTVWVLRNGAPVAMPVIPGESDGRQTAVTGEGLAEGDAAITDQSAAE
ncbi:efflux RND transporter periplasmic adaptor subunit [Gemmobacter aquarius]|uniref:Efflux RND transporter periplasmic adaptor subunit n=1 Tax=Paragemmobacter aquarius TaxID=2169400 RepID=A0A2S0UI60_9RHOB|nr:efflux RND transporter periplasmic adaptor subunit [Gemmobacter aquarius]AWB47489.1 efflux RND transporter periplasmic adaptor subunit [Gemmobacter aquarius]